MQQRRRAGQGLVEYVLVVGSVGLALVGAVKVFGKAVDRTYGKVTRSLDGIGGQIAATPAWDGAGPTPTRAMRMTEECTHPRALVDDDLGICTGCGESL